MEELSYHRRFKSSGPSARPTNLLIVIACFIINEIAVGIISLRFGSIRGAEIFVGNSIAVCLYIVVAFLVAIILHRNGWFFRMLLIAYCLIPPVWIYARYQSIETELIRTAPTNAFRELLADPIPESVRSIRFEPVRNWGRAQAIIWFEISSKDLDLIINRKGYTKVLKTKFLRAISAFENDPDYLRIGPDDEYYQLQNNGGDVFTLRVEKNHKKAVLRWDVIQTPH